MTGTLTPTDGVIRSEATHAGLLMVVVYDYCISSSVMESRRRYIFFNAKCFYAELAFLIFVKHAQDML